ncbi:hypothetical protein FAZ95_37315 [Trinickia violacea]|uniref:Uncharacterized protein n=1 Tax=Trinickia violacea TaxID=2571746 RepID=A0A4P8IYV6_9BURK|nr:hypothetical protein [Trinickia violacea]QCP54542.1 hypothetical protein FAZ95_37315 [Trinickia violacea]
MKKTKLTVVITEVEFPHLFARLDGVPSWRGRAALLKRLGEDGARIAGYGGQADGSFVKASIAKPGGPTKFDNLDIGQLDDDDVKDWFK